MVNSISSPSPLSGKWGGGVGAENSNLLIRTFLIRKTLVTSRHPGAILEVTQNHLITTEDVVSVLTVEEFTRVLVPCVRNWEQRPIYGFSMISHTPKQGNQKLIEKQIVWLECPHSSLLWPLK